MGEPTATQIGVTNSNNDLLVGEPVPTWLTSSSDAFHAEQTCDGLINRAPKIGQISFVNCLPVVMPFQRGVIALSADFRYEPPSTLNRMFAAKQLDVGAMSSFFFLSRNDLQLLPGLSIACDGAVGSVLLFSKRELKELRRSRILASAQSETSINLMRVLFQKEFGFIPELVSDTSPDLNREDIDAVLVIGDNALAVMDGWSTKYLCTDLGKWWKEVEDLPMVFGVWAARRDWCHANAEQFHQVADAHIESRELGLSVLYSEVLTEAERRTKLPRRRLNQYYKKELDFRLERRHHAGLQRYRQRCIDAGLL